MRKLNEIFEEIDLLQKLVNLHKTKLNKQIRKLRKKLSNIEIKGIGYYIRFWYRMYVLNLLVEQPRYHLVDLQSDNFSNQIVL